MAESTSTRSRSQAHLEEKRRREEPPQGTSLFLLVAAISGILDFVWQGLVQRHFFHHRSWPYDSPLLNQLFAEDLIVYKPLFKMAHTTKFLTFAHPPFQYPAPVGLLYGFFFSASHPVALFESSVVGLVSLAGGLFAWRLALTGVKTSACVRLTLGSVLLSYPLAFELRQGNMEVWIVLLVGAGIWCFWHERFHSAAALFGIAASMKLFPFVYLGLLLKRRQYLPIVTGIGVAGGVTIVALCYLSPSPTATWHSIGANLALWQENVLLQIRPETGFDHSIFGGIKQGLFLLHRSRELEPSNLRFLLRVYMPVVAIGGILLWFLRVAKLPFANQVLCLSVCSVLFTPNSYDYTLLHLYVAGGVLALTTSSRREGKIIGLNAAFVCLALATSYEGELIIHTQVFGAQFKALVLLVLLYCIVRYPFASDHELTWVRNSQTRANSRGE